MVINTKHTINSKSWGNNHCHYSPPLSIYQPPKPLPPLQLLHCRDFSHQKHKETIEEKPELSPFPFISVICMSLMCFKPFYVMSSFVKWHVNAQINSKRKTAGNSWTRRLQKEPSAGPCQDIKRRGYWEICRLITEVTTNRKRKCSRTFPGHPELPANATENAQIVNSGAFKEVEELILKFTLRRNFGGIWIL